MSLWQTMLTVGLIMLATILTRALPFWVFRPERETPQFVRYLGEVLPAAVLGMLVIYCYKDVTPLSGNHGLPANPGEKGNIAENRKPHALINARNRAKMPQKQQK